jgi:hypothetical protein
MSQIVRYSEALECRQCENIAPMRVVGHVRDTVEHTYEDQPPDESGTLYQLLSCPKCHKITIRSGFWHDCMDEGEWVGKVIFPIGREGVEGLPENVSIEFRAAERVANVNANAYAVLLGRVLDAVCNDRNAVGKTLHEKLTDLAVRHEIPKNLADVAHKIRQLRNVGAHADLGNLTSDEVPILDALCRAVLEYVYSAPKMVERVQTLIDKLKAP